MSVRESMQVEFHFDDHLYRDCMALVHRRPETILPDRFDRLLVEPHAKMTRHVNVLRVTLRINDELN